MAVNDTTMMELGEAYAEIRRMQSEIERLRAENERLRDELDTWKSVFPYRAPERVPPDRSKLHAEIERLRAALTRLRDCDWVISLPDRMDAVRDIARRALEANHD